MKPEIEMTGEKLDAKEAGRMQREYQEKTQPWHPDYFTLPQAAHSTSPQKRVYFQKDTRLLDDPFGVLGFDVRKGDRKYD